MREMTNEEAQWLAQFDYTYDRHRTNQRAYKEDSMADVRIRVDDGRPIDNPEEFTRLTPTQEPDPESKICLTPSSRGLGPRGPAYSPRDYWVLPSLWYSENWVDKIIWKIDFERGSKDDTGIPGIAIVNKNFKVSSFFKYENVCIGEYATLERAKQALTTYNQTVTLRGYGVDYWEEL
jgi:hypothetical protein